MLKSFLDQLPPTIKSPADNAQYQRLIDNWGTSYITWSNFGGGLNLDIFTNGSFDRSQSQEWKSDQHSLAFHFHLYDIDPSASIAGFTNKSQIHVNQSFVNQSRVRYVFILGARYRCGVNSLLRPKEAPVHRLIVLYASARILHGTGVRWSCFTKVETLR